MFNKKLGTKGIFFKNPDWVPCGFPWSTIVFYFKRLAQQNKAIDLNFSTVPKAKIAKMFGVSYSSFTQDSVFFVLYTFADTKDS